jgi:hypothetical protein
MGGIGLWGVSADEVAEAIFFDVYYVNAYRSVGGVHYNVAVCIVVG